MFATILRRWRLVTPLVLAVLAISIVSGGMIMPASAHNIKFHFFGRAYALNDLQPLPNTACDTGFLPLTGSHTLDSGHCFGAAGPGEPSAGVTGGIIPGAHPGDFPAQAFGRMYTIFADDTVASTHGNTSGKVVAQADLEGGINVCINPIQCNLLLNGAGINSTSRGCQSIFITSVANDAHSGSPAFVPTVFCANDVEETAFAFCHRHSDGSTQASVGAAEPMLNTPGFTVDNQFFLLGDSNGNGGGSFGLANETFTVSGSSFRTFLTRKGNLGGKYTNDFPFNILVTLNEQHPLVDGDLGAIAATGVHIVVTNVDDVVVADFLIAHVFAGIHCAAHLGTDQNMGTLVGD